MKKKFIPFQFCVLCIAVVLLCVVVTPSAGRKTSSSSPQTRGPVDAQQVAENDNPEDAERLRACINDWDPNTKMTKKQWRASCERTTASRANLPLSTARLRCSIGPRNFSSEPGSRAPADTVIDRPPLPGNWRLTFIENFDDDQNKLDLTVWTKNTVFKGGLGGAMFTEDAVFLENGKAHIITRRAAPKVIQGKTYSFASGLIQTFGKFTQKYGYFEAKITLPTTKGLWPAFWLMPDRKGCGDLGRWWENGRRSTFMQDGSANGYVGKGMEIDIMEHLTMWGPNRFHAAIHWDGYGEHHKKSDYTYDVPPSEDGSRIFGLYWKPGLLVWFVDNKEVHRIESNRIADVPMYMIINTTVGGWGGNSVSETAEFPVRTTIDWVRVWSEEK